MPVENPPEIVDEVPEGPIHLADDPSIGLFWTWLDRMFHRSPRSEDDHDVA